MFVVLPAVRCTFEFQNSQQQRQPPGSLAGTWTEQANHGTHAFKDVDGSSSMLADRHHDSQPASKSSSDVPCLPADADSFDTVLDWETSDSNLQEAAAEEEHMLVLGDLMSTVEEYLGEELSGEFFCRRLQPYYIRDGSSSKPRRCS